jgi:hypothetical protein
MKTTSGEASRIAPPTPERLRAVTAQRANQRIVGARSRPEGIELNRNKLESALESVLFIMSWRSAAWSGTRLGRRQQSSSPWRHRPPRLGPADDPGGLQDRQSSVSAARREELHTECPAPSAKARAHCIWCYCLHMPSIRGRPRLQPTLAAPFSQLSRSRQKNVPDICRDRFCTP